MLRNNLARNIHRGRFCGDPQIILIDDIYVMLFFRYRDGEPAFNTFACSRDLKN